VKSLHAKIGELRLENDFFRGRAHQGGIAERKAMIDRAHLPITKQAAVLRISRGNVYYLPRQVPDSDLAIMLRLDRLQLEFRFVHWRSRTP
jgi:putative transposase